MLATYPVLRCLSVTSKKLSILISVAQVAPITIHLKTIKGVILNRRSDFRLDRRICVYSLSHRQLEINVYLRSFPVFRINALNSVIHPTSEGTHKASKNEFKEGLNFYVFILCRGSTCIVISVSTFSLHAAAPSRHVLIFVARIILGIDFWQGSGNDSNDYKKCTRSHDPHVQVKAMRCELRENDQNRFEGGRWLHWRLSEWRSRSPAGRICLSGGERGG